MHTTWVDERGRTHYLEHHPTLLKSCALKLKAWEECQQSEVRTLTSQRRCGKCWLRAHQCYCGVLTDRKTLYDSDPEKYACNNTEIVVYYAFKEIGRGPNTAHIMEQLLPGCTTRIILGLPEQEKKLIDEMIDEYRNHRVRTCIMYPVKEAQIISEWKDHIATHNSTLVEGEKKGQESGSNEEQAQGQELKTRLVVLDGTYGDARRMFNYLKVCLQAQGVPCPAVKLDVKEDGFIKSAYLGIMEQPGRDKICTFQAVIMAMSDLGESQTLCSALHDDLDDWVHYLLDNRIKPGKEDIRVPSDLYVARGAGGGKHRHAQQNAAKQATQEAFLPKDSVRVLHERNAGLVGKGRWGKGAARERALEARRLRREEEETRQGDSWATFIKKVFCFA